MPRAIGAGAGFMTTMIKQVLRGKHISLEKSMRLSYNFENTSLLRF